MNDKKLGQIANELTAIKKLIILLLKKHEVEGDQIAQALGVSNARVSQLVATRKNKKRKPEKSLGDRPNSS